MNEKEMIEEMAKIINKVVANTYPDFNGYRIPDSKSLAEELLKHYQPKSTELSVMLTKEELQKIVKEQYELALKDKILLTREEYVRDFNSQFNKGYEKGSKEMAKEILDKVSRHYGGAWLVELYKEYGLEVK